MHTEPPRAQHRAHAATPMHSGTTSARPSATTPARAAPSARGSGFRWHKEPLGGFYCIYRKRSTEHTSSCGLPDCPGITATLTRHAKMLTGAGVDFIVSE